MAVDEALLRSRLAGGPPTVRFYGWREPTVSLGYGQALEGAVDEAACRRRGVALVRRPTGGSALLHQPPAAEVTYSVVARAEDVPGGGDVLETYRVLAAGLAAGLARLGLRVEVAPLTRGRGTVPPAFCFARTGAYEIAVGGRKLVGSAQRRQGGAFLQHGAVLLDADPEWLEAIFPGAAGSVTSLAAALGRRVGPDAVVPALAAGLAGALGVARAPGGRGPAARARGAPVGAGD
jgi:lipoate-protein ligase A